MKKSMLSIYWLNLLVMMAVPFVLVFGAKTHSEAVLSRASELAFLWLLTAGIFILFAIAIGIRLMDKNLEISVEAPSRLKAQDNIFLIVISLVGISLAFAPKALSFGNLWDAIMVYLVIFTASLVRTMARFIRECLSENIFL